MIIGMAGKTASGKTTIARLLEERAHAVRIKYSDILSDLARERGLDHTDKATLQNLFVTEREQRGEEFLSREMEHRVSALCAPIIVIEGNRRLGDIATLRTIAQQKNEKLLLLYIDASLPIRFDRYNARLKSGGAPAVSLEMFMELEDAETERELPLIQDICTHEGVLLNANTKTPEELFLEIEKRL